LAHYCFTPEMRLDSVHWAAANMSVCPAYLVFPVTTFQCVSLVIGEGGFQIQRQSGAVRQMVK
jgi:hypothetical protein